MSEEQTLPLALDYAEVFGLLEDRILATASDETTANDDWLLSLLMQGFEDAMNGEANLVKANAKNLRNIVDRDRLAKEVAQLNVKTAASEAVIDGMKMAMSQLDGEFERLHGQIRNLSDERNRAAGRAEASQKELSRIKKIGSPEDLIKQIKTLKARSSTLTKTNSELASQIKGLQKDVRRHREIAAHTAMEKGDERFIYSSEQGETLYLHPNKLVIETHRGRHSYVCFRYWNVKGLGRLISWDGATLNLGDAHNDAVNEVISPSDEISDFLRGWFRENIAIDRNKNQTLKTRR